LINIKQSFNFAPENILIMVFSDKQVQILESAERLFACKGFDATSVRDIADEAGVNVAMISYYFGSKEKLLESLFTYRSEASILKIEHLSQDKQTSALQKVNILVDYYIDKILSRPCFHQIMMREQVTNFRAATAALISDVKKRNQALVTQIIQQGQKKEGFKKNIDIPLMMATLVGTVSHVVTTQYYYKEVNNLQSLSDEEFKKLLKKNLSIHLKKIFKATLTHEV
jgi:AcrR family transcriptional regulator